MERMATWNGNMGRLDIARLVNAASRMEAQRNSFEHLLFGVVGRVVMWSEFDVGRMTRSARI